MRLSELSEVQREHLVWRIDHKTGLGLLTACRIAKGEFGDDELVDVFKKAGKSDRSARYHERAVARFKPTK